jgi:hypothetical protein
MTAEKFADDGCAAIAIFCDDIRHELGNKITLVGTYGTDMFVPEFPVFVPKMGVSVRIIRTMGVRSQPMVIRIGRSDGTTIAEAVVPIGPSHMRAVQDGQDGPTRTSAIVGLLLPPMSFAGPCTIRVSVDVEGNTYVAGKLHISKRPGQADQLPPAGRPSSKKGTAKRRPVAARK